MDFNQGMLHMPKIKFITHTGEEKIVEARTGNSLMNTAVDNGIEGVVAECGGNMSCATCHVYFDEGWIGKLDAPQAMEKEMLEFVIHPQPTSRLSCQIRITDELEGLVVYLPESQY